jgi:VIT1/CCC1 family predicted Fe2+/Mn2+ transporter
MPMVLADPAKQSKRALEPGERIAEVLFGLIMVLTFTGSLSIAEAGRDDIRAMLIGALGCNVAWGIIDAILYLMGSLAEKGRSLATFVAIRRAADAQQAHAIITDALPAALASALNDVEIEKLHQRLLQLPEPPGRPRLDAADWRGAAAVFLLVFCSTFPVVVPFIVMNSAMTALRVSNAVAVTMLFLSGIAYGRTVGRSPWLLGAAMVGLGSALVALTMALGG